MPIPLILIHGYSDKGESFYTWKDKLVATKKYQLADIHICSYRSLTNEITIKDIAEGFDRALRIKTGLNTEEPFDVIVHSTGMLVIRSWLAVYGRHKKIRRLIGIAPATFGSPIAHQGRSWLGSLFKGNRKIGPDFMEAGDLVLDGLELGSKFTWDLAHIDLLAEKPLYGVDNTTPYVFTFCGNKQYDFFKSAVTDAEGTDGTVRWAGCTLNTKKIIIDFTKPANDAANPRFWESKWIGDGRTNLAMPLIPVDGLNHGSIIEHPSDDLIEMALKALEVENIESYNAWVAYATEKTAQTLADMDGQYQQFVIKARDERGDAIADYNVKLYQSKSSKPFNKVTDWEEVELDVHAYSGDKSYRCFHINLENILGAEWKHLKIDFMASTGTSLLTYMEYLEPTSPIPDFEEQPTFTLDLSTFLESKKVNNDDLTFFYPYTTTLIEIILNREPMPLRIKNEVTWFIE